MSDVVSSMMPDCWLYDSAWMVLHASRLPGGAVVGTGVVGVGVGGNSDVTSMSTPG
jgi:hypothetical protein